MKKGWTSLAFLALFVSIISADDVVDKAIVKARVESCTHELKRIHQARTFCGQDLPLYHNVEFKNVPGAFPDMVFLNAAGDEVERIPITGLNRETINNLLLYKGFFKKGRRDQEVPEKYRDGPYVPHEDAAPKDVAPEDVKLEDVAPENVAPENVAPENVAPEDVAPENVTPENIAPENVAPEDVGPEDVAPENDAPEDVTPDDATPDDATPDDVTVEDAVPEDVKREDVKREEL